MGISSHSGNTRVGAVVNHDECEGRSVRQEHSPLVRLSLPERYKLPSPGPEEPVLSSAAAAREIPIAFPRDFLRPEDNDRNCCFEQQDRRYVRPPPSPPLPCIGLIQEQGSLLVVCKGNLLISLLAEFIVCSFPLCRGHAFPPGTETLIFLLSAEGTGDHMPRMEGTGPFLKT